MEKRLKEILVNEPFKVVDIDLPENECFLKAYNLLVPVLFYEDKEICHYHLDEPAVFTLLAQFKTH